jgi:hypothetical protein
MVVMSLTAESVDRLAIFLSQLIDNFVVNE